MSAPARPWPRGAATGIGSLPGTDPAEALRTVLGELPELPFLPELPARGPGADMIGRAAGLLVDLPVEIVPSGWRIASRPGVDLRRARDLLARDLDAVVEYAGGHEGAFKVAVTGPWTLAAGVELPNGHRTVTDHGAARDLAASLAEGVRGLVAELSARMPRATVVGQLDEPSLPAVLAGSLPTASGFGTVRHVDRAVVRDTLTVVLEALPGDRPRIVHCCADAPPVALLVEAGATGLALDLATLDSRTTDAVGEAVDADVALLLGVVRGVPLPGASAPTAAAVHDRLTAWWSKLGFAADRLADVVVPTPACGLAGASPTYAREVMAALREAGHRTTEPLGR